jgi:GNAT superfamily N-acetyltransferase
MHSLKKLAHCNEAIAVLVFDGAKLVGASTGLPLEEDTPETQQPLLSHSLNPTGYFHLEDSVLLPSYRGRGIGHHFFDLREAHAKHLKRFHHISFCTIIPSKGDPNCPKDYISLENFWKKRGYVMHPELQCQLLKKEIGKEEPVVKTLTFWLKELT